ncbi:histidine phosphatase family protein [Stakelama sediminis]|uniref:Phosphohistidine phosphatase n=1 Tax=Stakelama sediminis TaxID=463200 RepID=A0A840YZK9_9SPHN|nr:histidine phosphatase family protein [Stakelama sediminis]MBB5719138.1 phosphohistidine phosphatase [Stakelama sediminis]
MKTLNLLRHAKSGWDDAITRDFDRPLNDKGKRAAAVMGRHLRGLPVRFERLVASPALRVVQTLEHFAAAYGDMPSPEWNRQVYLASVDTLLDVIHALPEETDSVLLAGHNPGLEDLILTLVPDAPGQPLRDAVELKFPTGSFAEIRFDGDRWADVLAGRGALGRFVRPRDVDPSLGPNLP